VCSAWPPTWQGAERRRQAQGAAGFGPARSADALADVLAQAIEHVEAGGVAVVDVRVEPGYTPAMVASLNRHAGETA
jgi:acetolactate synthase-1/2/3 large subunit